MYKTFCGYTSHGHEIDVGAPLLRGGEWSGGTIKAGMNRRAEMSEGVRLDDRNHINLFLSRDPKTDTCVMQFYIPGELSRLRHQKASIKTTFPQPSTPTPIHSIISWHEATTSSSCEPPRTSHGETCDCLCCDIDVAKLQSDLNRPPFRPQLTLLLTSTDRSSDLGVNSINAFFIVQYQHLLDLSRIRNFAWATMSPLATHTRSRLISQPLKGWWKRIIPIAPLGPKQTQYH